MIALKALALAAFVFVPGWLAASLLDGTWGWLDNRDRLFLALCLGAGVVSAAALALSLASTYSLPRLLLLVGFASALLVIAAGKKISWIRRVRPGDVLLVILFVIVGLILFSPPGRTVFGWSDVGIYPNISANVVREGGEVMEATTVREVSPEHRELLYMRNDNPDVSYEAYENKAFFITDYDSGRVIPQFYFLWPAFMAVFASFLGLEAQFWAVTAMGILALMGIYLLAHRFLGWRWGLAVTVLGALSPLMIYFTRYASTEMMNMAFFIPGAFCLVGYLRAEGEGMRRTGMRLTVAASFFFTLCFLCRIDFLLVLIPIGLSYLGRRVYNGLSRVDWWFLGLTLAGAVLAVLVGVVYSAPYFYSILGSFASFRDFIFNPFALAFLVIAIVFIFAPGLRGAARRLAAARGLLLAVFWLALAGGFIFLYFVRPSGGDPVIEYGIINPIQGSSYVSQTMVRWGWYFSFVGTLAIFAGYGLWFTRRRRFDHITVGMIGFVFTLVYSWSMRCTPMHILTMRRLVPVVLPMAVIMIAYALKSLVEGASRVSRRGSWGTWTARLAAAAVLFYLVCYLANASIPIMGLEEGGNQLELCGEIAREAGEDAVVLMDFNLGDLFGPPLRCFYGVENGWIMDNGDMDTEDFRGLLGDLGFPNRKVCILWRPGLSGEHVPLPDSLGYDLEGEYVSREEMLEKSFEHRPDRREYEQEEIWLLRLKEEYGEGDVPSGGLEARGRNLENARS
ncbi:MAG: hypothetical protein SWK76_04970 [Actinomycetota bacterium]|nr:hypothetical protein [Actinomycetota bacterium]